MGNVGLGGDSDQREAVACRERRRPQVTASGTGTMISVDILSAIAGVATVVGLLNALPIWAWRHLISDLLGGRQWTPIPLLRSSARSVRPPYS
jgi:hypothetical protein